ncbi:hypothetical protein G9A89_020471 [Geosiphon pyriformis]|nr:hypothetical protein G9A89_020471 [Geosiphon pyriformis]
MLNNKQNIILSILAAVTGLGLFVNAAPTHHGSWQSYERDGSLMPKGVEMRRLPKRHEGHGTHEHTGTMNTEFSKRHENVEGMMAGFPKRHDVGMEQHTGMMTGFLKRHEGQGSHQHPGMMTSFFKRHEGHGSHEHTEMISKRHEGHGSHQHTEMMTDFSKRHEGHDSHQHTGMTTGFSKRHEGHGSHEHTGMMTDFSKRHEGHGSHEHTEMMTDFSKRHEGHGSHQHTEMMTGFSKRHEGHGSHQDAGMDMAFNDLSMEMPMTMKMPADVEMIPMTNEMLPLSSPEMHLEPIAFKPTAQNLISKPVMEWNMNKNMESMLKLNGKEMNGDNLSSLSYPMPPQAM